MNLINKKKNTMEKSKIDPLFVKFSKQGELPYVQVYIKIEKSHFHYKDFELSNDKNSPRLLKFKEELSNLFKNFSQSTITNYLSNINVIEADIHITDAKSILKSVEFNGIQVFGNDKNLLEKINTQDPTATYDEWESSVETMLILCSEIEEKARTQNAVEMIEIPTEVNS